MSYTSTKTFDCVSTAHRNWRAKANPNRDSRKCAYIHGYTKTFTFVFGCSELDQHQWVEDYGTSSVEGKKRTMTQIKEFIKEDLDHGVTTDNQDPMLTELVRMHELELIKLIVIPVENGQSGSVEGLCRYLYNRFDPLLREESNGRAWIESVTVSEHQNNSSTYTRPRLDINQINGDNTSLNSRWGNLSEAAGRYFSNDWVKKNFPVTESDQERKVFYFDLGNGEQTTPEAENPFSLENMAKTLGITPEQLGKLRGEQQPKQEEQKEIKAEDYLKNLIGKDSIQKLLTPENIQLATKLMKAHPTVGTIANTVDVGKALKSVVEKNPELIQQVARSLFRNK